MRRAASVAIACLLLAAPRLFAADGKLPVIDGKVTVATVNDDPITLEEFNRAIAEAHATNPKGKKAGRIDYSAIMNRLINTRLISIEGKNIGLDELPEVKNELEAYSRETLMKLLLERQVKDIKAHPEEVEKVYQELVKEWKITTVRFENEDAAKKFSQELKAGNNFEEAVKRARAEGLAREVDQGSYLKDQDLTLPVARLVATMEVGSVSPVVSVGKKGFVIFKLEGMRFPEHEDPEAWKKAKRQVLNRKRVQAAKDYYQDLEKKYVTVNEDLLAALDYESKEPGFEKLLEDKRVIVEIEGEEPITVGEFSEALEQKFYHGIEQAIASKRVNDDKHQVLADMLQRRVLLMEASKQGIEKTEEYNNRVKDHEISVIFGTFINKVIAPDITLDGKELRAYYRENSEEYTTPEMMRMKSLVFAKKSDAVAALSKLTAGTDFNWLSSKAEGQVDKNTKGLLKLEGTLLTTRSLPEDLSRAVSGANPGDFRMYDSPEGYFYVLSIYHVIPAKPQPFEEVKGQIAKKVFQDKVRKEVEIYADKLREHYPVKIYAKDLR
ncbi:MAG: peptidyl-prolyl cis-trans isomerase [Deltaproteobacteria bacterium]|nr:MAG: peptidyl-prolyl cis-trans isomerase [Deltaproteobacteria bacterium]